MTIHFKTPENFVDIWQLYNMLDDSLSGVSHSIDLKKGRYVVLSHIVRVL